MRKQLAGALVATQISWRPDVIFFRSTDGGATWTWVWDWTTYPNCSFRYTLDISANPWLTFGSNPQLPEVTPKLGWMTESLEIDPFDSNRMMYGTGATIYGTTHLTNWDSGSPITTRPMATGLEETAVLDLISPPAGAPLISRLGDVGGFRHTDLDAVPAMMFTSPVFTSTTSLDYAELNPSVTVRAGHSWSQSAGVPSNAIVESDRVNAQKFYAFASGRFYVSTNGGASFTAVSAVTEAVNIGFGKAAPGRTYPALYLVGTVDGTKALYRSDDAGASWVRITDDAHQYGNMGEALTGDPRVYGRVYLGANGRGTIYGDRQSTTPPDTTTTSWRVAWTFANGQVVSQLWGGRYSQSGSSVTVDNETWNGSLAPGMSLGFGFLASGNGANRTPTFTCPRTP